MMTQLEKDKINDIYGKRSLITDLAYESLYTNKAITHLYYNGSKQDGSEFDNMCAVIHLLRCQKILLEKGITLVKITAKRIKSSPVNKYIIDCTNI